MQKTVKEKPRNNTNNSRRALLRAGFAGLAGGGALQAQAGERWSPKKEAAGLRPGQPSEGLVSTCIRSGHLLFLSGIAGWYPQRRQEPGDAQVQMRSALTTMKEVLERAGSSMDNVLKVTVALVDPEHNLEAMNEGYKGFFTKTPPARSFFGTSGLRRKESLLQVDCIAYVD